LLRVETSWDGATRTLRLQGEVDLSNVHRAERELRALSGHGDCERVILDMTDLEFIDSAGIAWLIREIEATGKGEGHLQIRGVTPNVRRVLTLTGVDERLRYTN
jgi:anti-sigma B factor antagonist